MSRKNESSRDVYPVAFKMASNGPLLSGQDGLIALPVRSSVIGGAGDVNP